MRFAISDIEGDTLDTFDDQRRAIKAVFELIDRHPTSAGDLFLLAFEDDGSPFGDAVRGDELLQRRIHWQIKSNTNRPASVQFTFAQLTPGTDIGSDPGNHPDGSRVLALLA